MSDNNLMVVEVIGFPNVKIMKIENVIYVGESIVKGYFAIETKEKSYIFRLNGGETMHITKQSHYKAIKS